MLIRSRIESRGPAFFFQEKVVSAVFPELLKGIMPGKRIVPMKLVSEAYPRILGFVLVLKKESLVQDDYRKGGRKL